MPTSKNPKVERRSGRRHRASLNIRVHVGTKSTTVSTHDVCHNGLSCYLPEPLNLFTKYQFRLFVPVDDDKTEEIDGEGIVVRVEEVEVGDRNLFQTAFFFQHLNPGHMEILQAFMAEDAA